MENGYFIKNIDSKSKDYLNAKYPLFVDVFGIFQRYFFHMLRPSFAF